MAKSLIPEIARMLGVELGEEFQIKEYGERIYRFANSGLQLIYDNGVRNLNTTTNMALSGLLSGDFEIVKLPWKPKKGEKYWGFWYSSLNDAWLVILYTWGNNPADFAFYKAGLVYRTKEEAEDALPKVAAEMGVQYVL